MRGYVLSVMNMEYSIGDTRRVYIRYTYLSEIVNLCNKYKIKKYVGRTTLSKMPRI